MKLNEIQQLKSGLYIVPTPIGNLEDITIRALNILSSVDIIACEDTRHTGTMLKVYSILQKKLVSYFEQNEIQKSVYLVNEIIAGKTVALVSDAGSPGISDPGYRIIQEAIKQNVLIVPLPGATAFIPALAASGFPTNQFKFVGFPPPKKGRKNFLEQASSEKCTVILYESPYKILRLIDELLARCGEERQICVAREISKIYEEFIRGTIPECKKILETKDVIKGEFVIVLDAVKDKAIKFREDLRM